jgi:hypothetical protein
MKNFLVLIAFVFMFSAYNAAAQDTFYADEGYDAAVNAVSNTLNTPELMLCMAMDMTDAEGMPVPIEFDWETGKASLWIYYFVDKDNPEVTSGAWAMSIPLIGIQTMEADVSDWIEDLKVFFSVASPLQKSQLNSQKMSQVLTSDAEFNTELEMYKDNANMFITIFHNESFPGLEMGRTYWGVLFDPDLTDRACAMDIQSEDVICTNMTSIEDNTITENTILIANNPADEELVVKFNAGSSCNLSVYDALGNIVVSQNISGNSQTLDVSKLTSGAYFMQINDGKSIHTAKFMKR